MALNFSGLFTRRETNIQDTAGAGKNAPVSDAGKGYDIDQSRYFKAGQTLRGEVIAKDGNEVQIRLDKDTVIHARLDRDMNITVGQNMTFEVWQHSQGGGKAGIALRPLYENLTQDANVLKALSAASLPLSEETAEMVSQLMKAGLSIDIDSLQGMYKDMLAFPEAEAEDLAALRKLGLPVNEENLKQIASYRNLEHQILGGIKQLAEDAQQTLLDLVDTNPTGAGKLLHEILRLFGAEGAAEVVPEQAGISSKAGQNAEAVLLKDGTVFVKGAEAENLSGLPVKAAVQAEEAVLGQGLPENAETAGNTEAEGNAEAAGNTKAEGNAEGIKNALTETLSEILPDKETRAAFAEKLLQAGALQETAAGVRTGSLSMQELSDIIINLLEKGGFTKRALRELLGDTGFRNLLQNRMEENMLLRADDSFGKDTVARLYSKLEQQTAKLEQALLSAGAENSSMARSVNQLRGSLDFLNQLNQTFAYVQLPLKLGRENAHGDLYVYTNKRNLAREDGTVSALLHLDMEHLGSMDIYVALSPEKVSTKFYLEREELMDFLEQNMHILNERLNKRGYRMECEVLTREKPVQIVEEMMKQDGTAGVLAQYSFDVRA